MIRAIRCFIACLCIGFTNQVQIPFKQISTVPFRAKLLETDRLGNLYLVSPTNQLYKYNNSGTLLSTLNYTYVGNISQVDASNPMEIFVFYQELNKIIYLDNNLAYRGETNLTELGIGQAAVIARAFDNGIWVFDMADMQLKKMDKNGENLHTSGNVRQFAESKITPKYLFDNNDKVYLSDSSAGIFVFDVFATYIKTIGIKGVKKVKIIDDDMYYHHLNQLYRYNFKSLQTFQFSLPDSLEVKDISIEKSRLYICTPEKVNIYTYNN